MTSLTLTPGALDKALLQRAAAGPLTLAIDVSGDGEASNEAATASSN